MKALRYIGKAIAIIALIIMAIGAIYIIGKIIAFLFALALFIIGSGGFSRRR
jgi:hypothetical protein